MKGPNVKRLIVEKMSLDAIPPNTPAGGGLSAGIAFLSDPSRIIAGAKVASHWVKLAIQAVREAADPNPWRNADDEAIAEEILCKIKERDLRR